MPARAERGTRDDATAEAEVRELMAVRVGEAEDRCVGMSLDDHLCAAVGCDTVAPLTATTA